MASMPFGPGPYSPPSVHDAMLGQSVWMAVEVEELSHIDYDISAPGAYKEDIVNGRRHPWYGC